MRMAHQPTHPAFAGNNNRINKLRMSTEEKKITHRFENSNALKNAFMPFVRDSGIFIPTEEVFHLGDVVNVSVTLPEGEQTFTFSGEVIWITPKSIHETNHDPGIGVQCNSDEGEAFQKAVLQLLAGIKEDGSNTETM